MGWRDRVRELLRGVARAARHSPTPTNEAPDVTFGVDNPPTLLIDHQPRHDTEPTRTAE